MKKLIFLVFFLAFLLTWQIIGKQTVKVEPVNVVISTPAPTVFSIRPTNNQTIDIEMEGKTFRVSFIKVASPSALLLLPNFSEKLSSQELMAKNNCQKGVNAGFYDTSGNHLGLFIADGQKLKEKIKSNLFNGIFSVTETDEFSLTETIPPAPLRLAVQSGPLLIKDRQPLSLKIVDDKPARRIVVAKTTNNQLYFLAIYDKNSSLQGPLLADLPKVLTAFTSLGPWESALNLDGGSASAFYTDDLELTELANVGGWFCVK